MGTVSLAENGEWLLRYTGAAGRDVEIRTSAPKDGDEALLLLHHCELQACAIRASGVPMPPPAVPWSVIWAWWKSNCLHRYSAGWQKSQVHIVERYLLPLVGNLCPGEISPLDIQGALSRLVESKTIRPSTANAIRSVGGTVVADAILSRLWPNAVGNPFRMFKPFRIGRRIWPTLTTQDAARLIRGTTGRRRAMWSLALYMGLRRGELFALRSSDFDLKHRALVVSRSHERDTTKNGDARRIPIVDELLPLLEPHLATVRPGELVFPGRRGNLLSRTHHLPRNLRADMAAAGIVDAWEERCRCGWKRSVMASEGHPDAGRCPSCGGKTHVVGVAPDIRGHDLRHTFATLATEAGVSPDVVRLTLGHHGGITSIYQHLSLEAQRRELARLSIVPLSNEQ